MDKLPEANNIINEMAQIDEDLKRYRENIKSHQENLDKFGTINCLENSVYKNENVICPECLKNSKG